MAHKGYTLNYFIDFFSKIADHRWTEGTEHVDGTVQKCAIGHVKSDLRAPANASPSNTDTDRYNALARIFGSGETIFQVNDADSSEYAALGNTPRGRILKALRNKKRTGDILGRTKAEREADETGTGNNNL